MTQREEETEELVMLGELLLFGAEKTVQVQYGSGTLSV